MRYLCPKHAELIRRDTKLAMTLWEGAMESGSRAIQQEDWAAARSFYGTAYDTALLQLWKLPLGSDQAAPGEQKGEYAAKAVKPSSTASAPGSTNQISTEKKCQGEIAFALEHLVDAGTLLGHALGQLGMAEEAQICLLTLQVNLLQGEAINDRRRALALSLTQDYVQQLVSTAGLEHRLQHSRALRREIRVSHNLTEHALH